MIAQLVEQRLLTSLVVGSTPTQASKTMDTDVKLYNIVDIDGEHRFIIVKGGCYYGLTYDNIEQLKELFKRIETDEETLRAEIKEIRRSYGVN